MSESAIRRYGQGYDAIEIPNLMELQLRAYARFLQADRHFSDREDYGLESILGEIFPITSYDGKITLNYLGYELCIGVLSRERGRVLALSLCIVPLGIFYITDFLGEAMLGRVDLSFRDLIGWLPAAVMLLLGGPFCWRLLRI